ncbi:hypothetical protein MASR2M8_20400 [Opitutaceae bacterium]
MLIPLTASRFAEGWNWGVADYVLAWVMMTGVGFVYALVTRKSDHIAYRLAAALALLTAFMIVWGTIAVGFIGSDDNPANMLYGGVLLTGMIGAGLARFSPVGMAWAMVATAIVQMLVPVVAYLFWRSDFSPGVLQVFALNLAFALLFVASAGLFHHAARQSARSERA